MNPIPERLQALRTLMREHGLSHYLVPSADEHINEYLPGWGQRRPFMTGFRGSAGDALIGLEEAWLFTDGRYHLQAELELHGSGVQLSKVGAPGHPSLEQFLQQSGRKQGSKLQVGYDPMVVGVGAARQLAGILKSEGAGWKAVRPNLVDAIWTDRPQPVQTPLTVVPPAWTGQSADQKIAGIRQDLERAGATALVLVKLDQLAWLFNWRSAEDIPFNPVFEGYAYLDQDSIHLFLHGGDQRLPAEAEMPTGLQVHHHHAFLDFLGKLPTCRVLSDPSGVTMGVQLALEENPAVTVVVADSPVEQAKSRKNPTEQESMRRANRRASAAKVRALHWLDQELAGGRAVTEKSFQEYIEKSYAQLEDYWGLSFDTISATGPHGAIMHYNSADESPLEDGTLFLIDSGAQVAGGTTDDTRTVAVGQVSAEQKRLYTLVLQCHMAAASQIFPAGTPGTALDALCRMPLWREGLDFDHGTGHGVGCFLNVHEGPFAISERERKPFAVRPLAEGMVTSIEPGFYKNGWGGIRLENLYLIVEDRVDENGRQWLRFEPLTFIPFDQRLIELSMLSDSEKAWLDAYHTRVKQELGKEMEPAEVAALS